MSTLHRFSVSIISYTLYLRLDLPYQNYSDGKLNLHPHVTHISRVTGTNPPRVGDTAATWTEPGSALLFFSSSITLSLTNTVTSNQLTRGKKRTYFHLISP